MENEKFKEHPYFSDYGVITAAFDELIKNQRNNFIILRDYKGAICETTMEQITWENKRIEEVKKLVLNLMSNKI